MIRIWESLIYSTSEMHVHVCLRWGMLSIFLCWAFSSLQLASAYPGHLLPLSSGSGFHSCSGQVLLTCAQMPFCAQSHNATGHIRVSGLSISLYVIWDLINKYHFVWLRNREGVLAIKIKSEKNRVRNTMHFFFFSPYVNYSLEISGDPDAPLLSCHPDLCRKQKS